MSNTKKPRIRRVQETQYGVYVWKMPDGSIVQDADRNIMSIQARENDIIALNKLRAAADFYGVSNGEPLFLPGHRKVTQTEWEEQRARQNAGLLPDIYDPGVAKDEVKHGRGN